MRRIGRKVDCLRGGRVEGKLCGECVVISVCFLCVYLCVSFVPVLTLCLLFVYCTAGGLVEG